MFADGDDADAGELGAREYSKSMVYADDHYGDAAGAKAGAGIDFKGESSVDPELNDADADVDGGWLYDSRGRQRQQQEYRERYRDMLDFVRCLPIDPTAAPEPSLQGGALKAALEGTVWRWDDDTLVLFRGDGVLAVVGRRGVEYRIKKNELLVRGGVWGAQQMRLGERGYMGGVHVEDGRVVEAVVLGKLRVGESWPHGWLDRKASEGGGSECVIM
jgi:hypothetical protein